jgi:hypothetical protein
MRLPCACACPCAHPGLKRVRPQKCTPELRWNGRKWPRLVHSLPGLNSAPIPQRQHTQTQKQTFDSRDTPQTCATSLHKLSTAIDFALLQHTHSGSSNAAQLSAGAAGAGVIGLRQRKPAGPRSCRPFCRCASWLQLVGQYKAQQGRSARSWSIPAAWMPPAARTGQQTAPAHVHSSQRLPSELPAPDFHAAAVAHQLAQAFLLNHTPCPQRTVDRRPVAG